MSVDSFKQLISSSASSSATRRDDQERALAAFESLGVPTVRSEEWKYTNVLPLFNTEYRHASASTVATTNLDEGAQALARALPEDTIHLSIVNGTVQPFSVDGISGLTAGKLDDDAVAAHSSIANAIKLIDSKSPIDSHPFVAVNTAVSPDTLVVHVAANVEIKQTLHITVITDTSDGATHSSPRIVVVCEKNSHIGIVESHHTVGTHQALSTSNTQFTVDENAEARYVKINDDIETAANIAYSAAYVQRNGTMRSTSYCLGGAFTRNDLRIELLGEGAEGYLDGVSVLSGSQYADNHTVVDHAVPHCHSEELYKGVYDDKSVGVFNGKVFVRPQAQKTTAYQSNHTLLMSDKATVNAKPQLEIWADDVKCSHGATTGQLDEDAIFYLQARGIGEQQARNMMTYAFAAEVVERLHLEGLRSFIEQRIASSIGTEAFDR